ncbi:hydrolase 76 protein [Chytriomyces hyalinus]|nr:hydrolase 76 protein [Chytriomyces hyalinus]
MHSLLLLVLLAGTCLAQQLDLTNKDAILKAAKAAVWPLRMFFDDNTHSNGAWVEQWDDGSWNVQWHESGEYWSLFYEYMLHSGDASYLDWVDKNMQLSAGSHADFLDGMNPFLETAGRWNDDIGWWGIATMAATEAFGKSAIVAKNNLQQDFNPTYFDLTNNTFEEIWMGWNTAFCNGGIWWSRSRTVGTDAQKFYKSTITNVEEMELGARLFALTGVAVYKERVDEIYAWLKSSGLLAADFTLYDGLDSRDCSINRAVYSYHAGCLLAALSFMYQSTKNTAYINDAHKLFDAIKRQFVDSNSILSIEPSCAGTTCQKSPHGYSWAVYRGLGNLFAYSPDAAVKSSVSSIIRASAAKNFAGCDSNWYCIRNMPVGTGFTLQNGTNVRDQFETVAILNALSVVNGGAAAVAAPGATQGVANDKGSSSAAVASQTGSSKSAAFKFNGAFVLQVVVYLLI